MEPVVRGQSPRVSAVNSPVVEKEDCSAPALFVAWGSPIGGDNWSQLQPRGQEIATPHAAGHPLGERTLPSVRRAGARRRDAVLGRSASDGTARGGDRLRLALVRRSPAAP